MKRVLTSRFIGRDRLFSPGPGSLALKSSRSRIDLASKEVVNVPWYRRPNAPIWFRGRFQRHRQLNFRVRERPLDGLLPVKLVAERLNRPRFQSALPGGMVGLVAPSALY